MPAGWQIDKAYLDVDGTQTTRDKLFDALNSGVALVSYTGHGGWTGWSLSPHPIVRLSHLSRLHNAGRPTVFSQFTPWTNYYVRPDDQALGVQLMLRADGAAASMAASTRSDVPALP